MKVMRVVMVAMLLVSACSGQNKDVRVSRAVPAQPEPAKRLQARTEPVFYNGKTYTLAYEPAPQGRFTIAISGMTGGQQKDATNVAISAIRYFACPDGKTGLLVDNPQYLENEWRMTARCG